MTPRRLLSIPLNFGLLMAGLALGSVPAGAQEEGGALVSAAEPAAIIKLLRDRGQTAILTIDEFNDPFIETSFGNRDYSVWFYGCTAHEDCQSISLQATRMSPGRASLEALNDWNAVQRWTKVYSAEVNAAVLEMDISFRAGPMTSDDLSSILDIWDGSMEQFVRFIDDGEYDFVD
ncbi:MAG: YbjN domain-containing protein [Pseudomonadota bacterium]